MVACSLLNRGQLAQKYFPGYCHWRQTVSHSSHHCCQPHSECISGTNTAHSRPLCPRQLPATLLQPSPSCHQQLSSDALQKKQQKDTAKSDVSPSAPSDTHEHVPSLVRQPGFSAVPLWQWVHRGRGEGWREAALLGSNPGSNQQCTKELTLSWRSLHKLLSNSFKANHSRDLWLAPCPGFNPAQGTAASSYRDSSALWPLDTLEAFTAWHKQQRYSPTSNKTYSLAQTKAWKGLSLK